MIENLFEPWVWMRLAAGGLALALFVRGALTAQKVLRRFDARSASEGQLALERQVELSATLVRVGAVVQVLALLLSVLGADRLSRGVRGAMCAYGVFTSGAGGFRALLATASVAVVAGVVTQLHAFDREVRGLDLTRALAVAALVLAPLSAVDLALTTTFLTSLDLTAVASCCSVQLDPVAAAGETFEGGPRVLATALAVIMGAVAIVTALHAARRPSRARVVLAGAASVLAIPPALAATALEVAPHAFEVPNHVCPFCLLRTDALGLGYPLFLAVFLAGVWIVGAGASALLAGGPAARAALPAFGRSRLVRGALAWALALALGALPVARYAVVSGGASLFEAP